MKLPEEDGTQKPELGFADLGPGVSFRHLSYSVTPELVAEYVETVGDRNPLYGVKEAAESKMPLAPPGLAAIYSRLSYLQDHTMPSGGVLAGQEFEFHGPIPIGHALKVTARVSESYVDEKGRKRVNFVIEAKDHEGRPVSTTRLRAIWPK
jgi:acyl dehydratase